MYPYLPLLYVIHITFLSFCPFFSPEKHNVRPGAPSEPNEYNFNYRRRGLFIIINNKNFSPTTGQVQREGTDVDAERLEETFQDTGFEVRRYDDVPGAKMTKLMYDGKFKSTIYFKGAP